MNDEGSSAAAASSSRVAFDVATDSTLRDEAPTAAQVEERRKNNRDMFNKKRVHLSDDLIYNLDLLVYAQLSAIYYMDCSFLRLMLRALTQFVLLTPKPPTFVQPPDQQPFVGAVLGTNFICIALHIWLTPASGTEATRGYLHGGLAMDFVGQQGPANRFVLVLFDLLVMALQFVHLTAHISRKRLKDGAAAAAPQARPAILPPSAGQDLDSEERGVRHSVELERQDDIEMQTLNSSGAADVSPLTGDDDETDERDSLLSSAPPPRSDVHIFDAFHSGQIVLADLNVWKTIRDQFWAYQKSTAEQRDARRASYRAQLTSRLMDFGIARFNR